MDAPMKKFLQSVVGGYLESGKSNQYKNFSGFNADLIDYDDEYVRKLLREAVDQRFVDVVTSNIFENPFVRPTAEIPLAKQLQEIEDADLIDVFIYPKPKVTRDIVDLENFPPYTYQLALGKGVHDPYYFDQQVLDVYRAEPTKFDTSKRNWISARDDYYESLTEEDQKSCWGPVRHIGYRKRTNHDPAVAMCLAYLADLQPDEQQCWFNCELVEASQSFEQNSLESDEDFYRWYYGTIRGQIV